MFTEYTVLVLLVLSGITLVSAMLALASWFSSLTGGHPRTRYWSKLFAGVAYIALGLDGILASSFLADNQFCSYLLAWVFLIMGGLVFRSGVLLRKQALSQK